MTFHDELRGIEELGCDIADDFKEDIRESKQGKLKIFLLGLLPVAEGATLSGIGRAIGYPELVAAPLVMELINGGLPLHSPRAVSRTLYNYTKYAVGATLPYADKIYLATQNLVEKF